MVFLSLNHQNIAWHQTPSKRKREQMDEIFLGTWPMTSHDSRSKGIEAEIEQIEIGNPTAVSWLLF